MPTMEKMPETAVESVAEATADDARIDLEMTDLAQRFAEVARPVVQRALVDEAAVVARSAWDEEAANALRGLLQDPALLQDSELAELARISESRPDVLPPDREEIEETANEVGRVLAAAWIQLLALSLEHRPSMALAAYLLPAPRDLDPGLQQAFVGTLRGLPLSTNDVMGVLERFAAEVPSEVRGIDLPLGLALEMRRTAAFGSYAVRRRSR